MRKYKEIIKRIFKLSLFILGGTFILMQLFIIGYSIYNIDTNSGCVGDYVEKIQKKQLTGGCGYYCGNLGFHVDECSESFKNFCVVVARTGGPLGCSITLTGSFWQDKSIIDKYMYLNVNTLSCYTDYVYVKFFGNRNIKEILHFK